jgi:N4-gp56 family major capsid protein
MADTPITAGTGGSNSIAMGGLPTKTTNFERTVTALVERTVLENLRVACRWLIPGAYMPGRLVPGTNLIRHIAYGDLSVKDPIVATEGRPPETEPITIGYAEYGVQQRVRLVEVTDVALALNPHELMSVAAERVAWDALRTVDKSVATAIMAGTGIPLTVAGTGVVAADVRRWVARMKTANIPTFPDGYYVAMIHPAVAYDLQSDTNLGGWIEASKYADPSRLLTGEIGRMYGVRFVETTVGTVNVGATDTYNTVVFGPDYFAFGDLQSIETYMVRPGGDHADPAAQSAIVGYKGMWGAKTIEVAEAGGPRFGKVATHAGTLDLSA